MIRYYIAKVENIEKWSFADSKAICASYSKENMDKVLEEKNKNNKNDKIKFVMLSQKH